MFRNEWTTPSLLFAGALDCADYVKTTGKSNEPQLDLDTMRAHCMSNTQVCVYDQSCGIDDNDCEFTGEYGGSDGPCKPTNGYMGSCDMSVNAMPSARIPAAYLGPMNRVSVDDMEVCND
ncbi:MAG: hypothetical protein Q9184_008470 [Pyrenodesmia sp. 2 TL-2023]